MHTEPPPGQARGASGQAHSCAASLCTRPVKARHCHNEPQPGQAESSCPDDTRAQPFLRQREFVRKYKPRISILLANDYEDLHPEQRADALRFVLDGKDKNTEVADKGQ